MRELHRKCELIEAKARALVLADRNRRRADEACDRESWHYFQAMRLQASRELRQAMRGVKLSRLCVAGQRVVRCADGFRVIPGEETDGATVAVEAVIL